LLSGLRRITLFGDPCAHAVDLACQPVEGLTDIRGSLGEVFACQADLVGSVCAAVANRLSDRIELAAKFSQCLA